MAALPHATTRQSSGGGFLLGMFAGLLIGLAVALGIALYLNKTPIPFMSRKPVAEDAKAAGKPPALAGMPQGGTAPAAALVPKTPVAAAAKAPEKPRFDFYKILPGGEEPVSERELRERLRAAARRKSQPAPAGTLLIHRASRTRRCRQQKAGWRSWSSPTWANRLPDNVHRTACAGAVHQGDELNSAPAWRKMESDATGQMKDPARKAK